MAVAASGPIVLIGAGNMGGAMLAGWLKNGIPGSSVIVIDPGPAPAMAKLIADNGARHETVAPEGVKAGVLFIAVKPQVMDQVLPPLKGLVGPETVVVSVAAGKTLANLESHLGAAAMVRAMPNTPAMIGRGVTGAFANGRTRDGQRDFVHSLLKVSGPVEWVASEGDIDAVTAVSGSGPAYVFYLVECMAEAGRKAGLPADLAMRLARETVAGAGELLHQSPDDAGRLRQNVTSPGGTTAAALSVLMADDGMQPLFDKAIAAARKRAEELAGWPARPVFSMTDTITYADFERVDIRVGTIVDANAFPEARKPAYKLSIDFGPEIGIRKSSAQITVHYTLEDLVGRQVLAVVNFPPRQIGPVRSEVLTLGFADENGAIVLAGVGQPVPNGMKMC